MVPDQRRYVPGTNVLETTWHTPTGWITVRDLLVMGRRRPTSGASDYRRVPGDTAAQGTLLRIATCFSGRVEVSANCVPLFDYGRKSGEWTYDGERLRPAHVSRAATSTLELDRQHARSGVLGAAHATGARRSSTASRRSSRLSWGGHAPDDHGRGERADRDATEEYWRDWLSMANFPDHALRPYLERSALALKALSYAPTGAIMAAGTTSLPGDARR